jgi:MoaA/NifB/PqqE/SkfB family radical SAM enzyme
MERVLGLVVTTRCDYFCHHCIRGTQNKPVDIDLNLFKKVLPQANALGFSHVALTGGEAQLHPQFDKIVQSVVEAGFTWSVVTNGSHPQKYFTSIRDYGEKLKLIAVSLDGITSETNDKRRISGSYDRAIAAIDYFKNLGRYVRLAYLVCQENYEEAFLLPSLALSMGVDSISFGGLIPTLESKCTRLDTFQRAELAQYLDHIEPNIEIHIKYATSLYLASGNTCGIMDHPTITINPYGEMIFCCDTPGRGLILGSLFNETFDDLYLRWVKTAARLKRGWRKWIEETCNSADIPPCLFCSHNGAAEEVIAMRRENNDPI